MAPKGAEIDTILSLILFLVGFSLNKRISAFEKMTKNHQFYFQSAEGGSDSPIIAKPQSYMLLNIVHFALENSSSSDEAPSFLWAIVGVSAFVVLAAIIVLIVNVINRYRRHQQEENLYQSLIADDVTKGIHYTA